MDKTRYFKHRDRKEIARFVQARFKKDKEVCYIMYKIIPIGNKLYKRKVKVTSSDWVYDRLTDKGYKFYNMIRKEDCSNRYTLEEISNIIFD
jgi:hypothetical protein